MMTSIGWKGPSTMMSTLIAVAYHNLSLPRSDSSPDKASPGVPVMYWIYNVCQGSLPIQLNLPSEVNVTYLISHNGFGGWLSRILWCISTSPSEQTGWSSRATHTHVDSQSASLSLDSTGLQRPCSKVRDDPLTTRTLCLDKNGFPPYTRPYVSPPILPFASEVPILEPRHGRQPSWEYPFSDNNARPRGGTPLTRWSVIIDAVTASLCLYFNA